MIETSKCIEDINKVARVQTPEVFNKVDYSPSKPAYSTRAKAGLKEPRKSYNMNLQYTDTFNFFMVQSNYYKLGEIDIDYHIQCRIKGLRR